MKITDGYIDKIDKSNPLRSKQHLYIILKSWLKTDSDTIGNLKNQKGVNSLIWIKIKDVEYNIHADTTRSGVELFIENSKININWYTIQTRSGSNNKVTNSIDKSAISGFYMYKN